MLLLSVQKLNGLYAKQLISLSVLPTLDTLQLKELQGFGKGIFILFFFLLVFETEFLNCNSPSGHPHSTLLGDVCAPSSGEREPFGWFSHLE